MVAVKEFTEEQLGELAQQHWEVDMVTTGPVFRVFTHVVIRRRLGVPSYVKASSSDTEQMKLFADYIQEDLKHLTNAEFMCKYKVHAVDPGPDPGK